MTHNILSILISLIFSLSVYSGSAIENIVDKNRKNSHSGFIPSSFKGHSFGLGLGQTFLHGDFSKNGENSITVDAYYEYKASYSFDLLINAHFSGHKMGEKESNLTGIAAGIKGKILNFDAFTPYFVGGLGFYLPTVTRSVNNQIVESDSKVTFWNTLRSWCRPRVKSKLYGRTYRTCSQSI